MLSIANVSKSYGKNQVIKDLNLFVQENIIYGFVGENGAGKTTTMKMILGLLRPDSGEITVNGEMVRYGQNTTNTYIGYLPDVPEFYGYMTPMEYLKLCGEITGIPSGEIKNRSHELLQLVGLEQANRRIHGFSRGMKQRLGIAQALINRPKLLICDEPTSALDPMGRKDILDILLAVKEHTTVMFSTHILTDVERICDRIAFLKEGNIALEGSLDEIKNLHRKDGFQIDFQSPQARELFMSHYSGGTPVGGTQLQIMDSSEQDMIHAFRIIADYNIMIQKIERSESTLEAMYMEVVGK